MKFLADENLPADVVAAFSESGHDILWVRREAPGITDPEVLAWAAREERLLLTFDKDFGELAFRSGLPLASGVILFRVAAPRGLEAARALVEIVASRQDWAGSFAVIEQGRIRIRALPQR